MIKNRLASVPAFRNPLRRRPREPKAGLLSRHGRAARLVVLLVLAAWIVLAAPVLSLLLPRHPWTVLFLTLAAPGAILAFVIGDMLGWLDRVHD